MAFNPQFVRFLREELKQWAAQGLITPDQAEKISQQYPPALPVQPGAATAAVTSDDGKRSVGARIPAVLCGIAVLLIGTGLILFYAANWRKMPPGIKLAQVILLMGSLYSSAYYFLFIKVRPLFGRSLLILAMLVFGAAISLVAQIFHISAHPTTHVLYWAIGVFLLSWVMNERWGMLLTVLLALVWNFWELEQHDNPNWLFVIWPVAFFAWSWQASFKAGKITALVLFFFWFYQIHLHSFSMQTFASQDVRNFILMHLPLGVILVASARIFKPVATLGLKIPMTIIGWFFIFIPFTGLSWPMKSAGFFLWDDIGHWPIFAELTVFTAAAAGLALLWRSRSKESVPWHTPLLLAAGYSVLCLLLPNGHRQVLLVTMYLGLLGFHFATLYSAHDQNDPTLKALAFSFACATIVIKSLGLLIQAFDNDNYFVAFGLGGIFFLTVMFLMNEALALILRGKPFSKLPLMIVSTAFGYCVLYGLAFRHEFQDSIIGADSMVTLMLGLTLAVVIGLYVFLIRNGADKIRLGLSGIITALSLVVLFAAGPGVPWQAYAIVFNLLLLIFIGVLLYESVRHNSLMLLNIALAGFVLLLVTRYIDIFWDLLSGSLLFIVTGILIFGGGVFLERNRRKLAQRIKEGQRL